LQCAARCVLQDVLQCALHTFDSAVRVV